MKEFCLKQDAFFIFFLSTYSTQTTKHDQTVRMYESKPIIVAIQIIRVLGFAYIWSLNILYVITKQRLKFSLILYSRLLALHCQGKAHCFRHHKLEILESYILRNQLR